MGMLRWPTLGVRVRSSQPSLPWFSSETMWLRFNISRKKKKSMKFLLNARHHVKPCAGFFAYVPYLTLTTTLWHSEVSSWHTGGLSQTGTCRWPRRDLSSRPEWALKSQGNDLLHEGCKVWCQNWTLCVWIPAPVHSNVLGNLCNFSVPQFPCVLNWDNITHLTGLLRVF